MPSNCGAGEDSWQSLGQQGDKTSQSYRRSTLNIHCVRPKIRAFVPRWRNHATQWTSPADATSKRVYFRLRKPGDSDLLRGRAHRTANWASFYRQKPHCQHITYGLQSDWLQHYLYHTSTSGDKRDPDVCSDLFLEKPQFCNFYGKSRELFVQFSETPHCFILTRPLFLILQVSHG